MARDLTRDDCLLLQRYHDEELSAAQSVEAEQLLGRSAPARVFVRALEELSQAARVAGEVAWQRVEGAAPSPTVIVELAASAEDLAAAPLEELAPLLERFHDAEVDDAELAFVRGLLAERDDAVEYLAELDTMQQSVRAAGQELVGEVDFSAMWDGIAAHIGAPSQPFDRSEHVVLLQRYFDGEADDQERQLVEGWIDDADPQVAAHLEALSEVGLGVTAAVETALERAPMRDLWTGVRAGIEQHDAQATEATVVSLDGARRDDKDEQQDHTHGPTGSSRGWFGEYRQAIVGALAAAVVLAGLVGLFKDAIFGPQERVVVEKRVVIVEQVEYSPGASVMIDSPVREASAQDDDDDATVIWLFDGDEEAGGEAEPGAPADGERDAGGDADTQPDAGPRGQPI